MSCIENRLIQLREERLAREKARIEKLRQLNLQKYNKTENSTSNTSTAAKPQAKSAIPTKNNVSSTVKNNFHVNGNTKRPISSTYKKTETVSNIQKPSTGNATNKDASNIIRKDIKTNTHNGNKPLPNVKNIKKDLNPTKQISEPIKNTKNHVQTTAKANEPIKNGVRKSLAPKLTSGLPKPSALPRKSILPQNVNSKVAPDIKVNGKRESVFDRLYKPKITVKKQPDDITKLQTDPNYLKKVLKDSGLILNKRHTVFDVKAKPEAPVRRSISAVHFKRISKNEINNCIHKWSSIGEKLDKIHLNEIDEDAMVKADKVVSAIKSERKKVKFQTPIPSNFNTPRPEELQSRLKSWLQKRGKSLDSYQHLQCFGLHHVQKMKPIEDPPRFELYDDEDKENIAVEHDSDNESFTENMNDVTEDLEHANGFDMGRDKWRRASYMSEGGDLNETRDTVCSTVTSDPPQVDELLTGALNDLADLLKEGFDWEQCARWLRAVRERFPRAPDTAAYWECRAALEERRGDLPASVQCWEEAIAKGTERSVVEANLDQLLDKFMQLKISPNSARAPRPDPKMLDVKNVFKSTIIRFAVQQARLRKSSETPQYTVTPVRRSARLSSHWSARRTPLQQVSTSIRRMDLPGPLVFVPNDKLCESP